MWEGGTEVGGEGKGLVRSRWGRRQGGCARPRPRARGSARRTRPRPPLEEGRPTARERKGFNHELRRGELARIRQHQARAKAFSRRD